MIKSDGTVIHFQNPTVQAAIQANTFCISGKAQNKSISEMMPGILSQLGSENMGMLQQLFSQMGGEGMLYSMLKHATNPDAITTIGAAGLDPAAMAAAAAVNPSDLDALDGDDDDDDEVPGAWYPRLNLAWRLTCVNPASVSLTHWDGLQTWSRVALKRLLRSKSAHVDREYRFACIVARATKACAALRLPLERVANLLASFWSDANQPSIVSIHLTTLFKPKCNALECLSNRRRPTNGVS